MPEPRCCLVSIPSRPHSPSCATSVLGEAAAPDLHLCPAAGRAFPDSTRILPPDAWLALVPAVLGQSRRHQKTGWPIDIGRCRGWKHAFTMMEGR
jgi:hypothetical protein